jgi:hypothetical protein
MLDFLIGAFVEEKLCTKGIRTVLGGVMTVIFSSRVKQHETKPLSQ